MWVLLLSVWSVVEAEGRTSQLQEVYTTQKGKKSITQPTNKRETKSENEPNNNGLSTFFFFRFDTEGKNPKQAKSPY